MGIQMNANGSSGSAGKVGLQWPADGLESVPICPVCGSDSRELLHEGLTDRIFFCAPGEWSMYRCESCASAYLDPRPNSDTIGLAYQNYFTHEPTVVSPDGLVRKLRRRLGNGYRNQRYGTRDYPASKLGILAATLMPNAKSIMDAGMRHLPKASSGKRLLDLGCGNGAFLLRARGAGWLTIGVDLDPKAVEVAQSQRLDVRLGGVEELHPADEQFDVITLSHVIEHVHHPLEVLQACHSLLKPDGNLWIETPNINSQGYRFYGANWRGLEPPRHLVLFSLDSMHRTLNTAGFSRVEVQPYRPLCDGIFGSSEAIAEGVDPFPESRRKGSSDRVEQAERIEKHDSTRREFITVKAWKK